MSHAYRDLSPDKQEELFSNYMFDRWSFSKVSSFARNEKAFEMSYIYIEPFKLSASSVAGNSYHEALEFYFSELKKGVITDIIDLQVIAFNYISSVLPYDWKIQKTTPTIEDCQKKATKSVSSLLTNFFSGINVYLSELKEVVAVEEVYTEFITINGVDIPLPCKGIIDLVILTKSGKRVVIDHKSKVSFSDEKEMKFSIGKQAVTYCKLYEARTGEKIDEVWFVENKISKNRDGSPQMVAFKIEMNEDTFKLYEALLYEPLKRMLEAISDPDYVYLINENDNFVDKVELYEFWARTMISEVEDFNIPENKKETISKRLKKIRNSSLAAINPKIIKNFRENAAEFIQYDLTNKDMTREEKIEHILRSLGLIVSVDHTFNGYSSDTFLISISAGTNLASINKYKLDIASALSVSSIRMAKSLFVHEGKSYIAIEAEKVRDRFLMFDEKHLNGFKIPIGVDNFNNSIIWDLENPSTPHMLICGSTGSGKTVSIISTIEYAKLAQINRIIIFDPKYELTEYANTGISVINDIEDIEYKMESLVDEMNDRIKSGNKQKTLIIFDEFADAISNSKKGKDLNVYEEKIVGFYKDGSPKTKIEIAKVRKSLEENLRILLQKGRSTGYRIVAATQRASVKVITGDAKVNFPVQICFKVPKEVDSKVVIDESGAECLTGKGDGLIKSPEYSNVIRFQAFYKE